MLVLPNALNSRHLATNFRRHGMDRKWHCLAEDEARAETERALTAYGFPFYQVTPLKYLGRVLSEEDNNWPVVVRNLRRARQKWARLTRVLSREGAYARTLGHIYLAVVQSVMLYGSETWVLTPHMLRVLGGFHYRVSRRMTGRQPQKGRDGSWVYPLLEDAMVEVGLQEVETYVS